MRFERQAEIGECGLACLAMIASKHGDARHLHDLRRTLGAGLKGLTLRSLISAASTLGFSSRPVKLPMEQLCNLQLPCILHWDLNHFVVLKKVGKNSITVLDPAVGERKLPLSEVSRHFTGVALELNPNADFKPVDQRQHVALSALTGKVLGLKRSLLQIFAVAVVLELFAITSPLLNQLVVDDAIATHDLDLLAVLIIGFALLLVVQTAMDVAQLTAMGRDVESAVLARAVVWHAERRVLVNGHKTVIFK